MYRHNDHTRPRILQDFLHGKRRKDPMEHSYGLPVNHPRSIVARSPNIEMSQLSMDSYLASQLASLGNIPPRQTPASTRSSSASASAREQRRQGCYHQNNPPSSSDFGGDREGAHTSLHQYSQSSLSGNSIKSSMRKMNRNKMKKTRFTGVDHEKENLGRNKRDQGSFPTSRSSSSAKSCGSHCMPHDEYLLHHQNSTTMPRSIHSGSSSCHPQGLRHQDSHPSRRGDSERALVLKGSEQRKKSPKRSPKKQRFTPSTPVFGSIFSKIAAPRKRLVIPYPPIKSLQREQDSSSFRQSEEGRPSRSGVANTKKDGNMCLEKESESEQGKNDATSGFSERFSNDETQSVLRVNSLSTTNDGASTTSTSASGYRSNLLAQRSTMDSSSNAESLSHYSETIMRREHQSTAVKLLGDEPTREEGMEAFEMRLRNLLSDMEREAKANFQKASQTITSASESKLDEKAKALQEVMKVKIDEKANAIQEATKSNLNLLGQKRDEAEKAIETLVASTTTAVKETASVSVQNIQACTESGLGKLKRFTESWLGNNCKAIANRLKPFFRLSSESNTAKDGNCNIVGGHSTNVQRREIKANSVVETPESNHMKRSSLTPLDNSPKDNQDEKLSSSLKGDITLTQDSKHISAGKRIEKSPIGPLRRSKRTKQSKKAEGDTNLDGMNNEMTTPTNDKKNSRTLPPISGRERTKKSTKETKGIPQLTVAKPEKALCVTPIEGNPPSKMKKSRTAPSSNIPKVEPKRLKPLRSKRRKRAKPQTPLKTKRARVECDVKSRESIPSEVFAFDDIQLSPLESSPNAVAFTKKKKKANPKKIVYGSRSASKPSSLAGKKRRTTKLRTYNKRKKAFDVTDDDLFSF